MMVAVYFCIIMVSWMGAQFIVVDGTLSTGDLTSLFSYIMSLLMSLMMLSMVVDYDRYVHGQCAENQRSSRRDT